MEDSYARPVACGRMRHLHPERPWYFGVDAAITAQPHAKVLKSLLVRGALKTRISQRVVQGPGDQDGHRQRDEPGDHDARQHAIA